MPTDLEAKYAERDALSSWLETLEREDASLEAVRLVRAQLDRVLEDIARLGEGRTVGFGSTGKSTLRPPQCAEQVTLEHSRAG
jgi:hypothetical protein